MGICKILIALLLASVSCSATPPPSMSPPASSEIISSLPPPTPNTTDSQPKVMSQSYEEFAHKVGVEPELISVAQFACNLYNRCNPGRQVRVIGCTPELRDEIKRHCPTCSTCDDGCDLPMIKAWCDGVDCRFGLQDDPRWDACRQELQIRQCDGQREPIRCELIQEVGLDIRPTDFLKKKKDWKPGQRPPSLP